MRAFLENDITRDPFQYPIALHRAEGRCCRRATVPALLALLLDLVERLSEAFERVLVGRLGAAARSSLHRQVGALAHGVDHARLLGDVLDPGPVVLVYIANLAVPISAVASELVLNG